MPTLWDRTKICLDWLARNVYCQIPHLSWCGGNQQASGVEKKKDCMKSYLQLI